MKLYAICLVKNEDDIIRQTLTFATRYCDKIFVIDNGSSDRTWDIAQELSAQYSQIVPFEQTLLPYSDGLRALVYNQVYQELGEDDWWLILDADEFLAEDPRPLISQAMKEQTDVIKAWQIQFYFTERDLQQWEQGSDSRELPVFERRRYYQINWQELRLFRNQPSRRWTADGWNPDKLKRVCSRRILNRHYQYRDPEQIEKRVKLRFGNPSFQAHVTSLDWRTTVRDPRKLGHFQDGDPWRFSPAGILYYYRMAALSTLQGKFRGAMRRIRRTFDATHE